MLQNSGAWLDANNLSLAERRKASAADRLKIEAETGTEDRIGAAATPEWCDWWRFIEMPLEWARLSDARQNDPTCREEVR
jgi:hypothetical protein